MCVLLSVSPAGGAITSSTSHVAVSKPDKCQAVSPSRRFTRARFNSSPSLRASDLARLKAKCLLNSTENVRACRLWLADIPLNLADFQGSLYPVPKHRPLEVKIPIKETFMFVIQIYVADSGTLSPKGLSFQIFARNVSVPSARS